MTPTREARIEVSTRCNFRCRFCPHGSPAFTRPKQHMTDARFALIVDKLHAEAPQITDLTLSGMGEVFTDPGLVAKVTHARRRGYAVHLVTNGSLVTPAQLDELLGLEVASIRVSLHTLDAERFGALTGAASGCLEAARWLVSTLWRRREAGASTRVIVTADILPGYEDDVEPLVDTLNSRCDLLEIWRPHNWGDWGTFRDCTARLTTCGRPFNGPLQVQVDGTINVCCFDYNGKLTIGAFISQPLADIFDRRRNPFFDVICRAHEEPAVMAAAGLVCGRCDQRNGDHDILYYDSGFGLGQRVGRTSSIYEVMCSADGEQD